MIKKIRFKNNKNLQCLYKINRALLNRSDKGFKVAVVNLRVYDV